MENNINYVNENKLFSILLFEFKTVKSLGFWT